MFDPELRKAELEAILEEKGWRAIRDIAAELGIEKPSGGWDDSIPEIVAKEVELEKAKTKPLIDVIPTDITDDTVEVEELLAELETPEETEVKSNLESEEWKPKGTYATAYYQKLKIPYCVTCGEQYHSDPLTNSPVCPESYSKCPRLKE